MPQAIPEPPLFEKFQFVSDDECKTLIMSIVHGQGVVTEAQAQELITWANQVRADAAILGCVLKGALATSFVEGAMQWTLVQPAVDEMHQPGANGHEIMADVLAAKEAARANTHNRRS